MNEINRRIRAAGVIWRACSSCGTDWPFQTGCDPTEMREFRCAVCVNAEWAALMRAKAKSE